LGVSTQGAIAFGFGYSSRVTAPEPVGSLPRHALAAWARALSGGIGRVRAAMALALVAAAPGPDRAPAAAAAIVRACDDGRAVEVVRAVAKRESLDVSTLQLVVEGPYGRAKFIRTHPTFRPSPALKRKLEKRAFYFVWFHPPFLRSAGARGTDVWALVDAERCALMHLARER